MPPIVNPKLCDGCTVCVRSCPGDIIYFDKITKLPVMRYPDECWHCGLCRIDCLRHLKKASAIDYFFPRAWLESDSSSGKRMGEERVMRIGACVSGKSAFRGESTHAYDLSQDRTTFCGIDLHQVEAPGERQDLEPTCSTCREARAALLAK